MSKKISQASRIRSYFSSAPLAEAQLMLDLARDIVRERGPNQSQKKVSKPKLVEVQPSVSPAPQPIQ